MFDVPIGLAVGAGMVASVNPCGFAMLPAYVGFFVGTDTETSTVSRVRRALVVSSAMTAGFITVFGTVGLLVQTVASTIDQNLSKVTVVIGLLLVMLGVYLLTGRELRFNGPKIQKGGRERTFVSMYLFGVSYATASLSCTLGPFLVALTPTFRDSGVVSGMAAFVSYGVGMGMVITFVTVAVAFAQQTLVTRLRKIGPLVNRIAGAMLVLAGAYVAWYGYWEINGDFKPDPVVDRASSIQSWLTDQVGSIPKWFLAAVVGSIVVTFMAFQRFRKDSKFTTQDDSKEVSVP